MTVSQISQQYQTAIANVYQQEKIHGRLMQIAHGARYITYDVRLSVDSSRFWKKAINAAPVIQTMALAPNVSSEIYNGLIRYNIETPNEFWKTVYRESVSGLEVGLAAGRKPVSISFDHGGHSLMAGTTGSGKSVFISSALCALSNSYSPEDAEVYICDPHNDYVDNFRNFALLGLPIAQTKEEIKNIILHVYEIYRQRKQFNLRNEKRIVLIIDESQEPEALGNSDAGFNNIFSEVTSLAKGGRKYRMSLWVGSQRPSQKELSGIFDMLKLRYVGTVDNAQTSTLLTGQAGLNAHQLTGQGDMLHVINGRVTRFIAAMPTNEDYKKLPRAEMVKSIPSKQHTRPIIEDDSSVGRPSECLDDPKVIGFMLGHAFKKGALPGRVITENHIGLSRHYHKRYTEHIKEILRYAKLFKAKIQ